MLVYCVRILLIKKKIVVGVSLKKKLLIKMTFYNSELHMPDLTVILFRSKEKKVKLFWIENKNIPTSNMLPKDKIL